MARDIIKTVEVADRFGGDRLRASLAIFAAQEGRMCVAVETGCSTAHIRMTKCEAQSLIEGLQEAVAGMPQEFASPDGRKVNISHIKPPVPSRQYDYRATFDGYDEGDPMGYGPTAQAAFDDLMAIAEDAA
jgi:hypothetical protein